MNLTKLVFSDFEGEIGIVHFIVESVQCFLIQLLMILTNSIEVSNLFYQTSPSAGLMVFGEPAVLGERGGNVCLGRSEK
jgi:hypothetical protein